jgi:ribosomal protein S18 acetylase RimI-like enzyme
MLDERIRTLIHDEQMRSNGRFVEGVDLDEYLAKLDARSEILALTEGDSCRGFVAFYCNDVSVGRAFITLMLVDRSERRTGLGRLLTASVLNIAKSRGFISCGLEVATWNEPARAMFTSIGFAIAEHRGSKDLLEIAI